jgi:hypothetical protein
MRTIHDIVALVSREHTVCVHVVGNSNRLSLIFWAIPLIGAPQIFGGETVKYVRDPRIWLACS